MKNILVLGAGKSASRLITYLLSQSEKYDWQITVGDLEEDMAKKRVANHSNGWAVKFDVKDEQDRATHIAKTDIVVSLLPFVFHYTVAQDCLKFQKHLVTASYVDKDCIALNDAFEEAGLLFMGEIGLDPGIDHLATMKMIKDLKEKNAKINGVYSFAGALLHPESDNNPWHYKFTWAPMNVVKAGQGISQYLFEHKAKYIPYNRIFSSHSERSIGDVGLFEIYPNRDSVKYLEKYNLEEEGIGTFLRGTLRKKGYCDAWNAFVKLGWTDDSYKIDVKGQTYTDFLKSYLPLKFLTGNSPEKALGLFLGLEADHQIMHQLKWLGIYDHHPIGLENASPAEILCKLLEGKWKLEKGDKDMIVMLHEVEYEIDGQKRKLTASLVNMGEDEEKTAIAKLVGLPAGIMTKLIATKQVKLKGVRIPIMPEVYEPILKELATYGVGFDEIDEAIA